MGLEDETVVLGHLGGKPAELLGVFDVRERLTGPVPPGWEALLSDPSRGALQPLLVRRPSLTAQLDVGGDVEVVVQGTTRLCRMQSLSRRGIVLLGPARPEV